MQVYSPFSAQHSSVCNAGIANGDSVMKGSKYLTKAVELYPKVVRQRDSEWMDGAHKVVVTEEDITSQ